MSLTITKGWVDQAQHIISPNYNKRPQKVIINAIIIHGISLPPEQFGSNDINDFFTNQLDISKSKFYKQIQDIKVSAHFLVRRKGELIQYVDVNNRAWHAGKSSWAGVKDCNNFSIGIELEGTDTIPYEKQQYLKLAELIQCLMVNYPNITQSNVIGHKDIAPGRKTDPGEVFDWSYLFKLMRKK